MTETLSTKMFELSKGLLRETDTERVASGAVAVRRCAEAVAAIQSVLLERRAYDEELE